MPLLHNHLMDSCSYVRKNTFAPPLPQWRSQNRIVARAQVRHIYGVAQHAKVSVRKHPLLGGSGGMPPRKILEFRTSEIASAGFSGRVSVAKIRIPMQYSGNALVAIQLSRKLLLVLNVL